MLFFDDSITTDNKDIREVMVTVIQTLPIFFAKYPDSYIHFRGSDEKRTRFYKWIIERNLNEFRRDYVIYGIQEDLVELFKRGKTYEYFFISKK